MKKILLIFCALILVNMRGGFCAYYYAEQVEAAVAEIVPAEFQEAVLAEYDAQIDEDGYIDEDGMAEVCAAFWARVDEKEGLKKCQNLVNAMESKCVYRLPRKLNGRYYIDYYLNPQTYKEAIEACIVNRTISWAIELTKDGGGNEGEYQNYDGDSGNCICDARKPKPYFKNGHCVYGKNGTKYGISSCTSKLSKYCLQNMQRDNAKEWYFTNIYMAYHYHRLPIETQALVTEMAISGIGHASNVLKTVLVGRPCDSDTVVRDLTAASAKAYVEENGADAFNRAYVNAVPKGVHYERRQRAYKYLSDVHEICAKEIGIDFKTGCSLADAEYYKPIKAKQYEYLSEDYVSYVQNIEKHNEMIQNLDIGKPIEEVKQNCASIKTNVGVIRQQEVELDAFEKNLKTFMSVPTLDIKDENNELMRFDTRDAAVVYVTNLFKKDIIDGFYGKGEALSENALCYGRCMNFSTIDVVFDCNVFGQKISRKYVAEIDECLTANSYDFSMPEYKEIEFPKPANRKEKQEWYKDFRQRRAEEQQRIKQQKKEAKK